MYHDTIRRSEHKHSHVIVQKGSEKGTSSVKDSPGVHRKSVGIKLYQCVWNHGLRKPCPFCVPHSQINVLSKGR